MMSGSAKKLEGQIRSIELLNLALDFIFGSCMKTFLAIFSAALIFWFFCIKAKEHKTTCNKKDDQHCWTMNACLPALLRRSYAKAQ
jgi:predicted Co/Zn/Cd cation transporter (cation efflux family)